MSNLHQPLLVNTIGHSAGAIVFGMFLFLFVRDRAGAHLRGRWLAISAAALAVLWNVGSLAVFAAIQENSPAVDGLITFSFSMLSLLPAVLFHLSLAGEMRALVVAGYVLSASAVAMHCLELVHPSPASRSTALLLITIGFSVLTAISVAAVTLRSDRGARLKSSRVAASMCLLIFAMSFVHLSSGRPLHAWSSEVALHHAGIPLALFILLQDYRFVLLDAFIRFLANVLLAVTLAFIALRIAFTHLPQAQGLPLETLLLPFICVLLIAFAVLRGYVQRWLTYFVFRQSDLDQTIQALRNYGARTGNERELLDLCTTELARFANAEKSELVPAAEFALSAEPPEILFPVPATDVPGLRQREDYRWAEAIVPLRFVQGDTAYMLLGRRKGGRRYLSEDWRALGRLAALVVEQVERFRNSEMQRLVSQAELQALQSQINPHFLFNALNTLYGIIPREAAGARRTVINLADIFRYSLQSRETFIPLTQELEIVRAYLEIEKLRLGTRLQWEIDVDAAASKIRIPILSIQPLVENAVKHALSVNVQPGWVRLKASKVEESVLISVEDTGAGIESAPRHSPGQGTGTGLANVTRRLQLCFGPSSDLLFASGPFGTTVQFRVPIAQDAHESGLSREAGWKASA